MGRNILRDYLIDAPGLKLIKRKHGRVTPYWIADQKLVKEGYRPKSVRIFDDVTDPATHQTIANKCQRFQAEMLEWKSGRRGPTVGATPQTIAWLIEQYRSNPDSPFHALRPASVRNYVHYLKAIDLHVGTRRIDTVTGIDVRRWYKEWGKADEAGVLQSHTNARYCLAVLRIIANFGCELEGQPSAGLALALSKMRFKVPPRRSSAMSAEHVGAFIKAAHEAGFPSMARAVALQFSCALRQKDVIGEWVDGQWQSGLRWGEHITSDWTLRKPTSKSNFTEIAEYSLPLLPLAMAELSIVPETSRIGPVIIDEVARRPYLARRFAHRFRTIARAAGIPDTVWNMDSRAGAVTEALDSGAQLGDVMDLAAHKNIGMTKRYDRGRLEKTSRVAISRFGKDKP